MALCVAVWLGCWQRRLQKAQLKDSLYDRRFNVYTDCGKFLTRIMQKNGDLDNADLEWYVPVVEKGELLFGSDVADFLKDLQNKAGKIYAICKKAKYRDSIHEDATAEHLTVGVMMKDICGHTRERRKELFRPYLTLRS